jgi:hypothetical protein
MKAAKGVEPFYFKPTAFSSKQGGILMEIQPLHDRLVVKRIEAEEIVKGGIVIPDTAK